MDAAGYSRLGRLTGWALALLYLAHAAIVTQLARTDRALPLREEYRGWHYALGALILVAALLRLWAWTRERPAPPAGLPASAFLWGRALALATLLLLIAAPVLGLLYGWADDLPLRLGPVDLPQLVGRDRALWQFTGYFHSGMGFMLILINLATLLTALWTRIRFGHGLLNAFPPGHGAFSALAFGVTVYAFATFGGPEPGPRAVAIYVALLGLASFLTGLLHRRAVPVPRSGRASGVAAGLAAAGALGLVALGAYGPNAMFKVTPFSRPETVAAQAGVEWHTQPTALAAAAYVAAPDAFERQAEAETFKWCRFCHNFQPGGEQHKVGPNLYLILGQRAGGVPGFGYSEAMEKARADGLVWTEANLAAYVADPQKFMPGTSMIVSSGPIPDPRAQAAVVNLLKRETAERR
jgi:cytochrome c2/cytochrome b561